MIDLSKFEGHTEGPWFWDCRTNEHGVINHCRLEQKLKNNSERFSFIQTDCHVDFGITKDMQLIASAPELLEEVKQLRTFKEKVSEYFEDAFIQPYKDFSEHYNSSLAIQIQEMLGLKQ